MSYPNGYQYGQYAGYQGYAQAPQQTPQVYSGNATQYQYPMVVIPSQQPRRDVLESQTSPHAFTDSYQTASQPAYYQQSPSQYHTAPQRQSQPYPYALSQSQPQPQHPQYSSQGFPQQGVHYQQPQYQQQYHPPRSQPNYAQPVQQVYQQSPPLFYQPAPVRSHHTSPQLESHPRSSPDPLQGSPNIGRGNVSQFQQYQQYPQSQARAPMPQQRTSQQKQAPSAPQPLQHQLPPQQRVAAAVEIPVFNQQSVRLSDLEMPRSPKRRRSNEGHAVPVSNASVSAQKRIAHPQKPVTVAASSLLEPTATKVPPSPDPSVDYQTVLLSLTDEYIGAAYSMSTSIATGGAPEGKHEEYCALMSSAMACLESVLKNFRQTDARREARIRLRLAILLVDECDNDEEAEAVLGKGIALCDRSHLPDLKYAMQHLSARSIFRSNSKAALKSIDKLIQEVDALRLGHWVYAFRFLRVSLGLQLRKPSEIPATLKHLNAINMAAEAGRHITAQIVAASLEAIVHLHTNADDAVDSALRAMATARTHQLGQELQNLPQVRGLLDCLDVACALLNFNGERATAMMQRMQKNQEDKENNTAWQKDGTFGVELESCNNHELEQDTGGIMKRKADGTAVLVMQWLTQNHLFALGYALSGFTTMWRSPSSSDGRANAFLQEGLKMAKVKPDPRRRPLGVVTAQLEQQQEFTHIMKLFSIFSLCGRFEWNEARQLIKEVRKGLKQQQRNDDDTTRLLLYFEATCRQGLGDLQGALQLNSSSELTFVPDSKATNADNDIRALATLNSILILREQGADSYNQAEALLTTIEPYCLKHSNKAIHAALNVARATAQTNVIKTKQYLQLGVTASKEAANNLLVCIFMNVMTSRFFSTAIVGEQAEKSAQAARALAKGSRNNLWNCVADEMFGDIKERCGKSEEAEMARLEGLNLFEKLPEDLKMRMAQNDERQSSPMVLVGRADLG